MDLFRKPSWLDEPRLRARVAVNLDPVELEDKLRLTSAMTRGAPWLSLAQKQGLLEEGVC